MNVSKCSCEREICFDDSDESCLKPIPIARFFDYADESDFL